MFALVVSFFILSYLYNPEDTNIFIPKKNYVDGIESTTCLLDPECRRFGQLLDVWPANRPKSAIYILIGDVGPNTLRILFRLLDSLNNNYAALFGYTYPIIIFHHSDFNEFMPKVRNQVVTFDIFFQLVHFEVPKFLKDPPSHSDPCYTEIEGLNIRHSSRFHMLVHRLPIMERLEFYWRIDINSAFLGVDFDEDFCTFMKKEGKVYGFITTGTDPRCDQKILHDVVSKYKAEHKIQSFFYNEWLPGRKYLNFFEITDLKFWRRPDVRNFLNHIDKNGGIYYHSWKDDMIKTYALTLFTQEDKIHFFSYIEVDNVMHFYNQKYLG